MDDSLACLLRVLGGSSKQGTRHTPDLVALALGLSDLDSAEVIRRLRTWTEAPSIVLSGPMPYPP